MIFGFLVHLSKLNKQLQRKCLVVSFIFWKILHSVGCALVWPQSWSFADVSQQGVDFSKKISKIKIIFWSDFHRCSHGPFFDIENWLWKSDLGTFWRPLWTSVKLKSKNYFYFTDFFAKIKPLLTHVHKTPQLRIY